MKTRLCKKDLVLPIGNYDVIYLSEGKAYKYEVYGWGWYRVYETPGGKSQSVEPHMFDAHFYSKQEERKIKLKQIETR